MQRTSEKSAGRWFRKLQSRTGVFVLLIALLVFGFLFGVRQYVKQPISGDEPHYLLMDYSLVHDGDLDLKNNYQNYDYFRYYPAPTETHVSPLNLNDPSSGWYSFHGIGLPVILLPAFAMNERLGPIIMMTLFAVLVVLLTWVWAAQVTRHKQAALLAALLMTMCYFFAGLAGYMYPDLVTAALILGALIILHGYFDRGRFQLLFGGILGLMVVIHPKTLSIVVPLGLLLVYRLWRKGRTFPWLAVLGGLPFALFFMLTLERWFGVWNPGAIYPSNVIVSASQFAAIPAMLFDAKHGLLVYNPVLLLLFVGLPLWFKQNRAALLLVLIGLLPALAVTLSFNQWQGGYSPVGRYMMDFLPAFMPAVAFFLVAIKTRAQKSRGWRAGGRDLVYHCLCNAC